MAVHTQKRARWGPGILRLAGWLPLAAAALAAWPLAVVTAAGLAVARLRGWPAFRLGRQAGWTLPMAAVWIAAESARGWRALTLDPVRDGSSGWPHLSVMTVIRTFLLVAPVTIPAGLAFAALLWAWRTSMSTTRTSTATTESHGRQAPDVSPAAAGSPAASPPARSPVVLPAPRDGLVSGPHPRVPAGSSRLDGILGPGVSR